MTGLTATIAQARADLADAQANFDTARAIHEIAASTKPEPERHRAWINLRTARAVRDAAKRHYLDLTAGNGLIAA